MCCVRHQHNIVYPQMFCISFTEIQKYRNDKWWACFIIQRWYKVGLCHTIHLVFQILLLFVRKLTNSLVLKWKNPIVESKLIPVNEVTCWVQTDSKCNLCTHEQIVFMYTTVSHKVWDKWYYYAVFCVIFNSLIVTKVLKSIF